MLGLRHLIWIILAVGISVGTSIAQEPKQDIPEISLFKDPGYQGDTIRLSAPVQDLAQIGFNDAVSSVRIESGYWEICQSSAFTGRCQVLNADIANLMGWQFDDEISSLRPVSFHGDEARDGLTLFSEPGFRGRSVVISGAMSDLGDINFNNDTRSIQIHSGEWEVCAGNDFGGRCEVIFDSTPDLRMLRIDGRISSIRLHDPLIGAPGTTLEDTESLEHTRQQVRRFNVSGGSRGLDAVFYAEPRVSGNVVAACPGANGWNCAQRTADLVCQGAGHSRAVYFDVRETRNRIWDVFENRSMDSGEALINLLCATI